MNAFWSGLHYHKYFVTFKVYIEQEGVYLTWAPQYLCGSLRLEDFGFFQYEPVLLPISHLPPNSSLL